MERATYTTEQIDILRRTPIEEVLRSRGFDTRHTRSGLYHSPFREDSNPSFHIDPVGNRFSDPGDFDPAHVKRRHDGSLNKQAGGDVVDLVMWLDNCTFSEALSYLASFNPGVTPEVRAETVRRAPGKQLEGYVNHSGGAVGSDTYWGEVGAMYGVVSRHYWHGRRTPNGNTEVSIADFEEGKGKVLLANRTLNRRPDGYMDLLARNWMQVREADAIFAVGEFGTSRVSCEKAGGAYYPVGGGTGWAAQMAIDAGKPLYFFDQVSGRWFHFTGKKTYTDTGWEILQEAPALTKNFAGIGTRKLNEKGRLAIRKAYGATLRKERALKEAPAQEPAADDYMLHVDMTRRVNIWTGSGENAALSNLAVRPFTVGLNRFLSVEHWYQWSKAVFAGDTGTAAMILSEATPFGAKRLGRQVTGLDRETWDAKAAAVMETGIRLSFVSNPDALDALLSTGGALLTHDQERGRWKEDFPRILMKVRREMLSRIVDDKGVYKGTASIELSDIRKGLSMPSLKDYFRDDRAIPVRLQERYLYEVRYKVSRADGAGSERQYAAAGFPNVSGQWALRGAPYMSGGKMNGGVKRSTGSDFSAIGRDGSPMVREAASTPGLPADILKVSASAVVVFEGFTDFLSWLAWNGKDAPEKADAVILNSVSNTSAAMGFIMSHRDVFCYLDNDEAGKTKTSLLKEEAATRGVRFKDCSYAYASCNDLNEAWVQEVAKRRDAARRKDAAEEVAEKEKPMQNKIG